MCVEVAAADCNGKPHVYAYLHSEDKHKQADVMCEPTIYTLLRSLCEVPWWFLAKPVMLSFHECGVCLPGLYIEAELPPYFEPPTLGFIQTKYVIE